MPKIAEIFRHLRNASHRCRSENPPPNGSISIANRASYGPDTPSRQPPARRSPIKMPAPPRKPPSPRTVRRQTYVAAAQSSCKICNTGSHPAYQCSKFLDMSVKQRLQAVRKANLCMNCLQADHATEACNGGTCRVCNGHHNTKLHQDASPQEEARKT